MFSPRDFTLTPATVPSLSTLADVKAYMSIAGADGDLILTQLLASASVAVETFCGCLMSSRQVVETIFQAETVYSLVLKFSDVTALTSLKIGDEAATLADIFILKGPGILRRKDGAPIGCGTIEAQYTAGPTVTPAPVVTAVHELVKALFESRARESGVIEESVPDVSTVKFGTDYSTVSGASGPALPSNVAVHLMPFVQRFSV